MNLLNALLEDNFANLSVSVQAILDDIQDSQLEKPYAVSDFCAKA
jgi:hypothetical protein